MAYKMSLYKRLILMPALFSVGQLQYLFHVSLLRDSICSSLQIHTVADGQVSGGNLGRQGADSSSILHSGRKKKNITTHSSLAQTSHMVPQIASKVWVRTVLSCWERRALVGHSQICHVDLSQGFVSNIVRLCHLFLKLPLLLNAHKSLYSEGLVSGQVNAGKWWTLWDLRLSVRKLGLRACR